jgi:glycosyltransferase involved in cell wall biosynthesis
VTEQAPSLAVMLPCYGDNPHLREAVASVLASDSDDWTLTLLDDGPVDDDLREWVLGLDPRVTYRHNPVRLGINRNFQQCLDLAAAPLVSVLGADDVVEPSYVGAMIAAAEAEPGSAFFHPEVTVIGAEGRAATGPADRVKAWMTPVAPARLGGEALAVSLLRGNWMYFPSVVFRTDAARRYGFVEGNDIVLDLDLYLRMLLGGEQLSLVPGRLFRYRRHEASLSSSERFSGGRFVEESEYFAAMADELTQHGWGSAARASRLHLTSRLHALLLVPAAWCGGRRDVVPVLLHHVVGRG